MPSSRVLFLSYDGMTDPLGQSQVIPYLAGLAAMGYKVGIVSFEKRERFAADKQIISNLLESKNIDWHPLIYTSSPPILSTLYDFFRLWRKVKKLHHLKPIQILHCRSYITALCGLSFKKKYGIRFVFDMRAFYADERVDGGIWNRSKWIYNLIFIFFKKREIQFLSNADYTISLTNAGKNIIHGWENISSQPIPIEVIPCCADLNHFSHLNINQKAATDFRTKLKLDDAFVLSYLGSLGTWYLEKEMFRFFKTLKGNYPNAKFLIITPDNPKDIIAKAQLEGIAEADLAIIFGNRADVPTLLSLSDLAIFFIQPLFSKQGSSPTKHGEILGMGIPVLCNAGVGDVAEITEATQSGILVSGFTNSDFETAIAQIPALLRKDKSRFRKAAEDWYALDTGIERYAKVYKAVLSKP